MSEAQASERLPNARLADYEPPCNPWNVNIDNFPTVYKDLEAFPGLDDPVWTQIDTNLQRSENRSSPSLIDTPDGRDWLYVGNLHNSYDEEALRRHGITAVLSIHPDNRLTRRWRTVTRREVRHHEVWHIMDEETTNMLDDLDRTCDTVDGWRRAGETVLVHCKGGKSRSTAFAAAFLMRHYGLALADAFDLVRAGRLARSGVKISTKTFLDQLEKYQELGCCTYLPRQQDGAAPGEPARKGEYLAWRRQKAADAAQGAIVAKQSDQLVIAVKQVLQAYRTDGAGGPAVRVVPHAEQAPLVPAPAGTPVVRAVDDDDAKAKPARRLGLSLSIKLPLWQAEEKRTRVTERAPKTPALNKNLPLPRQARRLRRWSASCILASAVSS